VSNSFEVLGILPEDVEDSWVSIRNAILMAARDVLPALQRARRPWLTAETLGLLDKKSAARLRGHADLCRKYKGIFKARSKEDLENYYIQLADEAENGVKSHYLQSAYRTIKTLSSNPAHSHSSNNGIIPIQRNDGQVCHGNEETLNCWRAHYQNALNHTPASRCPDLDASVPIATPDNGILIDAPTVQEGYQKT